MQKKDRTAKQETKSSDWEKTVNSADRNEKMKKYGLWAVIALVAFGGLAALVLVADNSGTPYNAPSVNENVREVSATEDIIIGNPDAQVAVIKYTDFQCPACASYNGTLKQIESNYPNDVKLVFRFFPIDSIHKNAGIAGQAAWAAWQLDKFSEMKDELYANQSSWQDLDNPEEEFVKYAVSIGLDEEEFKALMISKEAESFVDKGRNEAISLGINATPTFFIGKKEIKASNFDDFKLYIEDELGETSSSSDDSSESQSDSMEPTPLPLQ